MAIVYDWTLQMKKCCLLILAIASAMLVPAQSKPRPGPPKPLSEEEWEKDERNRECVFSKKFTAEQRSKFYPFNKAKEVRIVSFRKLDSLVDEQLPMANGIVDTSHFTESKTLNGRQRNLLSDILYNYKYRGIFHIDVKSLCYNPRNAVVFFDSKSRGFAFIEICFECDSYRLSSKRIRTGDFCEGKFDLLQEFFLKNGIRDGTVRDPEAND